MHRKQRNIVSQILIIPILFIVGFCSCSNVDPQERIKEVFNESWSFKKGEKGNEYKTLFNDSKWFLN